MNKSNVKTKIRYLLNTSKIAKISEILLVFILAFVLINVLKSYTRESLELKMAVIWSTNIFMLILVWLGIKLRGQKWSDFGLTFGRISLKESRIIFLRSLLLCTLGLIGYLIGTFVMANITGMPESADMSNYEYLHNNIFMLILTLFGVYIVSSFGEEVIYRAFIINRLTELGLDTKFGKMATVAISSIIFGLVHYEWGPTGIVSTALMGLVMGIFYLRFKKKLWILVLAHAYMDTVLLIQIYLTSQ